MLKFEYIYKLYIFMAIQRLIPKSNNERCIRDAYEKYQTKAYAWYTTTNTMSTIISTILNGENTIDGGYGCYSGNQNYSYGGQNESDETSASQNASISNQKNASNNKQNRQEAENAVKDILNNAGIIYDSQDDDFKKNVLAKYNTMLEFARKNGQRLDEDTISTRITNYAKAYQFHQVELAANQGKDVTYDNEDCVSANSDSELILKYKQFGAEYVELYDNDGDGSIDVYELFYQELIDYYTKELGDSREDAIQKAIIIVKEYNEQGYSINNMPNDGTKSAELFSACAMKIGVIDTSEGATPDGKISSNEAAAHLITMAQLCDSDNTNAISKDEFNLAELAIMYKDSTVGDIQKDFDCTDEQAQSIYHFVQKYATNINSYMQYFNQSD